MIETQDGMEVLPIGTTLHNNMSHGEGKVILSEVTWNGRFSSVRYLIQTEKSIFWVECDDYWGKA